MSQQIGDQGLADQAPSSTKRMYKCEYREVTEGVEVCVIPEYLPGNSDPEDQHFFFAYHVTITNHRQSPVQLLSRHWIIRNGMCVTEDVRGPGVVGEQPTVSPGQSFNYSSACPLSTSTGNMRGSFEMVDEDGQRFRVVIPLFFLNARSKATYLDS